MRTTLAHIDAVKCVTNVRSLPHVIATSVYRQLAHATDEAPTDAGARSDEGEVPVTAQIEVLSKRDAREDSLQRPTTRE